MSWERPLSSGYAGSYTVVSEAELRRRALGAARARLARVNQSIPELRATIGAAEATYGGLDISAVPGPATTASGDSAEVDRVANELELKLGQIRRQADDAITEARCREIDTVSQELLASMRPAAPLAPLDVRAPKAASSDPIAAAERTALASRASVVPRFDPSWCRETAIRVLGRLPGDTTEQVVQRCQKLVEQIAVVDTQPRGDVLLAALRDQVQKAGERSQLAAKNRAEIEHLHRLLDGLDGAEVAEMRGYLRGLPPDAPLPLGLEHRAKHVRDLAVQAQDREFALRVLHEVLEEHGYEVADDFATVVASSDGTLLPIDSSRHHGARVRERDGQMLFNVVRFSAGAEADDRGAITEFCNDLDHIVADVAERGVSTRRTDFYGPDSGVIEIAKTETPFPATGQPRKRSQPRDRTRERHRHR